MSHTGSIYVERNKAITIKDICWLAGLLEGEGCFMLRKVANKDRQPVVRIATTDPDVIARVAGLLNSTLGGPYNNHGSSGLVSKPLYETMVTGRKAVGWMLTLYSLLGGRRRERINYIIKEWRRA